MVEKIEVAVALVEVEFRKVIFCKVEEPFTRRLLRVPRPPVKAVAKRLVEEAVVKVPAVENKFVEVAFVVVLFVADKLV